VDSTDKIQHWEILRQLAAVAVAVETNPAKMAVAVVVPVDATLARGTLGEMASRVRGIREERFRWTKTRLVPVRVVEAHSDKVLVTRHPAMVQVNREAHPEPQQSSL
jgi:hypothetical protein